MCVRVSFSIQQRSAVCARGTTREAANRVARRGARRGHAMPSFPSHARSLWLCGLAPQHPRGHPPTTHLPAPQPPCPSSRQCSRPHPTPPPCSDLRRMNAVMRGWAKDLFPKGNREDTLDRISGWGGKASVKGAMESLRRREVKRAVLQEKPDWKELRKQADATMKEVEAAAGACVAHACARLRPSLGRSFSLSTHTAVPHYLRPPPPPPPCRSAS